MTLISSLVLDAYRESNMLSLGKEPNANQSAEALRLYNAMITAIYGGDAGESLTDWPLGQFGQTPVAWDNPIPERYLRRPTINKRLIAVNEEAMTVYLTPRPQDGARMGIADPLGRLSTVPITLDANGRTIEGTPTLLLNTNGMHQEWFYRAELGQWIKLTSLIATDENPFPARFDTFFITLLAMRLSPRYGRSLSEESIVAMKQSKREFIARYLQSQPLEVDDSISWPFMSVQGYKYDREFSSTSAWSRGQLPGIW